MTRSLATEYASRGVRVDAVAPGVVKTPCDPKSYDGMADLHPLGRMAEISDVVGGILYLEQAIFVTGETLHIDGGQVADTEKARQRCDDLADAGVVLVHQGCAVTRIALIPRTVTW